MLQPWIFRVQSISDFEEATKPIGSVNKAAAFCADVVQWAEAPRRAMLALIDDKNRPYFAHPLSWAP